MDAIVSDDFKPNSALIVLDFLVRHGFITPENGKYSLIYSSFYLAEQKNIAYSNMQPIYHQHGL